MKLRGSLYTGMVQGHRQIRAQPNLDGEIRENRTWNWSNDFGDISVCKEFGELVGIVELWPETEIKSNSRPLHWKKRLRGALGGLKWGHTMMIWEAFSTAEQPNRQNLSLNEPSNWNEKIVIIVKIQLTRWRTLWSAVPIVSLSVVFRAHNILIKKWNLHECFLADLSKRLRKTSISSLFSVTAWYWVARYETANPSSDPETGM